MAREQRLRRVADQIQKELAVIIAAELKDPRIALVTLTDVEVSPDLAHAKVFYTTLADAGSRQELGAALAHAAGFLRSQLSRRIKLQGIPDLHFEYDLSIERGFAIDRLIDEAVSDTAEDGGAGDANRRRPVSR
jgi:ribosome-binding factor A